MHTYSLLIFLLLSFASFGLEPTKSSKRLIFHSSPKALNKKAITSSWQRFNGPSDDASSPETQILVDWVEQKPKILWEIEKGEGYASPAIKNRTLILFHRLNGKEKVEALNSENGNLIWKYEYPVDYEDRYGYSSGPRASPVIDDKFVYTQGVTSWLSCLELKTGKLVWKRDLAKEFKIPNYFFGKGSNPIIFEDKIIVNVGGGNEECVIAFNKYNGQTIWIVKDSWGASYSSPRIASMHNRKVCLVFTGGESRPPTGGLLLIDPTNGEKLNRFSWRSSSYESANAVPPIPLEQNRVFLSECYEKGSVVLEYDKEFEPSIVWQNKDINIHWMTPVIEDKTMFGIAGRHQQGAETFCLNWENGHVHWKERISWKDNLNNQTLNLALFRGSILKLNNYFICLSELGSLLILEMNNNGWHIKSKHQLFFSPGTWTLPALSNGLLYIMQNETDRLTGKKPRMLCLDLRKS